MIDYDYNHCLLGDKCIKNDDDYGGGGIMTTVI